jgi:hypothetical protein
MANMVKGPADYVWSSYGAFVGEVKKPEWLDISLLAGFGEKQNEAKRNYRKFVEGVAADSLINPDKLALGGCILGGAGFVARIQDEFLCKSRQGKDVPQLKKLKPRIPLDTFVAVVASETGCAHDVIKASGRKRNQAREVAIYLARGEGGRSGVELGEFFGGVSGAAITMCCRRFSSALAENEELQGVVDSARRRIFNI